VIDSTQIDYLYLCTMNHIGDRTFCDIRLISMHIYTTSRAEGKEKQLFLWWFA